MLWFDGEYPTVHPKAKFLRFLVNNCKKSAVKHSIENPIVLNIVNLSLTFCPRLWKKCNQKRVQQQKSATWSNTKKNKTRKQCNVKRVPHDRSATEKRYNMKKVKHEISAAWKKCNTGKLQHEKCNMQKMQHGNNATWPKCNTKRVQHEKNATWKMYHVKKCDMKKVTKVKYWKKRGTRIIH